MTYTNAQARQRLLDAVAKAIDEIAFALAALGEAYEQLDEQSAERLEQELFKPVQAASAARSAPTTSLPHATSSRTSSSPRRLQALPRTA